MVLWYWSTDTLFWQLSFDRKMDVQYQSWSMVAMLCIVVVVVRKRPRAILLAIFYHVKSDSRFFFSMGHRLPALQAPGAPLLAAHLFRHKVRVNIYTVYFNSSEVYKWSSGNRPFAGSSHMARNKLHWDANDAVGLSKQRKVTLDW